MKKNVDLNHQYGTLLFDDQFRPDGHPAEYFYEDFLGFSANTNNKIQSKRFYHKTELFIYREVDDLSRRADLLSALRNQFTVGQRSTISPAQFGRDFISLDGGLRDKYTEDVCSELPNAFGVDDTLIKSKITKRQMGFPNKIKVVGPEDVFDGHVEVVDSEESMRNININSGGYTILKISGKPYSQND